MQQDVAPTDVSVALAAHQAGRLEEAVAAYRQILAVDRQHVDALHLLGVALQQTGDSVAAEALMREALALGENALILVNLGFLLQDTQRLPAAEAAFCRALELAPDLGDAHNALGKVLRLDGRLDEAEAHIRRALALLPVQSPQLADAYNNLGNILGQRGRPDESAAAYRQAIAAAPEVALPYFNLASHLHARQQWPEAEAAYRRALALQPAFAEAYNNLALLLGETGRAAEADALFHYACALKPDFAEAYFNHGNLLQKTARPEAAEAAYRQTLALNPTHVGALRNLGSLLFDGGRLADAEAATRQAILLAEEVAESHYNLGNILRAQGSGKSEAAEAAYRRALALAPDFADAYFNLGKLLAELGRLDAAEAAYLNALMVRPDFADARWNLAWLRLSQGRYAEAWPDLEARYAAGRSDEAVALPVLPFPVWRGEPLAGKSLVLWPEQGFGDYLQFIRYAPLLKARGLARLTVVCPPTLAPLLATVDGVDAVVSDSAALDAHDFWALPLSLPGGLGTTLDSIPATLPYVSVPPEYTARWRDRLAGEAVKVGLVWQGNPAHRNDAHRSLADPGVLSPLWEVAGVRFISLQKDPSAPLPMRPMPSRLKWGEDLGEELTNFADTAAVIAELDLLICVDTAVAHLAGALGKPCWLLLPATGCDWRWLRERRDSPWYPGALRLFRQSMADDWTPTLHALAGELREFVAARSLP
ncbi:tetratricopeptide repeat protein [Rhodocyclus tenuis]|uniref:Tetratricopeptide repeat protein n=1 Tax=Rhodocyclus gracilis TaxID=2929842 RepID=A0ABX0WKD5_9RHOO|nr:tetratricopeptide repeat protein [Rhodocyclus gracilis]